MMINDWSLLNTISPYTEHYIKTTNFFALKDGKYKLKDGVVLILSSYKTNYREKKMFESHKKYYDVQLVIKGREIISVCDTKDLSANTLYDENNDIIFYSQNVSNCVNYLLDQGSFLILKCNDGHMPCICVEKPEDVRKAVFKIPVRSEV